MKKPPLKTSIPVNIPLQILVVEKSLTGLDISKGSHIYCGLCGHTIGRVNKDLQLPMPHEQLLKTMSGVKVQLVRTAKDKPIGIYHKTCNKFLFTDKPSWVFIGYDEWKKQTDEMIKEKVMEMVAQKNEGVIVKNKFIDIADNIQQIKLARSLRPRFLEPIDWAEVQRIEKIEEENYNSIMEQMKLGSNVFKFIDDTKQEYIATGDYNTWWVLGLDESVTLKGLIDLEKEQPVIKWAYKALSNIGHYIPNNVLREWVNLMEGKEITTLNKPTLKIVKS